MKLLVQKYAEKQVNNIESDLTKYTISPEKYWEILRDYSQVKLAMYNISTQFKKKKVGERKVESVNPAV